MKDFKSIVENLGIYSFGETSMLGTMVGDTVEGIYIDGGQLYKSAFVDFIKKLNLNELIRVRVANNSDLTITELTREQKRQAHNVADDFAFAAENQEGVLTNMLYNEVFGGK